LNGRLARLEAEATAALGPEHCRACGLRHVRPLTIALLRSIMVVRTDMAAPSVAEQSVPMPRLCLCGDCCGQDRAIALMTHGRSLADGAA